MTYPRLAVCPLTGIKAIVRSAEEEQQFYRVPLIPMALGMVAVLAMLAVMLFALL